MSAQQAPAAQPGGVAGTPTQNRRGVMLALATIGFAVNFWAWALLSPLAPRFKDTLHLTLASSRRCWSPCRCSSGRSAGSRSAR